VHVHEGRLYVLHDAGWYARVLRLQLLIASIDDSRRSSLRNTVPHHRGLTVVVVRALFSPSPS
jgi:hypothetical protein